MTLAISLFAFAFIMIMFPKELPRAALRKRIAAEKRKRGMKHDDKEDKNEEIPASIKDMLVTFKRLLMNATFMLNNIAAIFYYFGLVSSFFGCSGSHFPFQLHALLDFHTKIHRDSVQTNGIDSFLHHWHCCISLFSNGHPQLWHCDIEI